MGLVNGQYIHSGFWELSIVEAQGNDNPTNQLWKMYEFKNLRSSYTFRGGGIEADLLRFDTFFWSLFSHHYRSLNFICASLICTR